MDELIKENMEKAAEKRKNKNRSGCKQCKQNGS